MIPFVLRTLATSSSWLAEHLLNFSLMGDAKVNKHGKKRSAMLWENASFPHYLSGFSPSPSPATQAIYKLVSLE